MPECFFSRLAGIPKLRKKAGESSSKCFFVVVVVLLFPSAEFSSVRWLGKCSMKNRLSSSSSFLPSSSVLLQGYVFKIPIDELFNFSSFLLWCRYRCDSFFQSSCVLCMIMFFHFQLCNCLMTAKEDSSVRLNPQESLSAASKL